MAHIQLKNVTKAFGNHTALADLNLDIADGEFFVLLGETGAGKTTTLRLVAGLEKPTSGQVFIDGVDVADWGAAERDVALVLQQYSLYPRYTVRENLEFPLRNRGVASGEIKRRVSQVIEMTGLGALANRRARGLSADEKQKVSLGRGLVREDVNAILFDEPLTVIDPAVKWTLRTQLRELQRRSGMTMIYVTHDQTEALTFASSVVVMDQGQVLQVGSPKDLFEKPAHTFVGYFIGSPGMNVMPTSLDGANMRLGEYFAPLPSAPRLLGNPKLELGVRPEFVRVTSQGIPASIERVEDIGRHRIVRCRMQGHAVTALLQEHEPLPADPHLFFDPAGLHLYADSWRVELGGAAP